MLRHLLGSAFVSISLIAMAAGCGGNTPGDGGSGDAAADTGSTGDVATDGSSNDADATADVAVDAGPPRLIQVAGDSAGGHSCALRNDGTIWCWGLDDNGQLGISGNAPDSCTFTDSSGSVTFRCAQHPVQVEGITDATAVTVGNGHSCALRRDGSVWCWGVNDVGDLGLGTSDLSPHPTPAMVLTGARSVSAGAFHTCAALLDGTVKCWGNAQYGQTGADPSTAGATSSCQIGTDTYPCSLTPNTVPGATNIVEVSGGRYFTCGRTNDGKVQCWGLNSISQLGTVNDTMPHPAPSAPFLSNVVQVSAGGSHACAVKDDHSLWCWGWNDLGQIGVPDAMGGTICDSDGETFRCFQTPTQVTGVSATFVAAMRGHTCAVGSDGAAKCWGRNDNGQLGIGSTSPDVCNTDVDTYPCARAPAAVLNLAGAVSLGGGDYHTCALLMDGTASCWGWNVYGQLGSGNTMDQSAPSSVTGLP